MYDYIVIGAGIVGSFIAHELSQYSMEGLVLEKENDVANEVTMANSGIIHAGFDPEEGTLKARLGLRGSRMYEAICNKLQVAYKKTSAFVVATTKEEAKQLNVIYNKAVKRGIPVYRLSGIELMVLEPALSENVIRALEFPMTAVITPWEVAIALMEEVSLNGGEVKLNEKVEEIESLGGEGYRIRTNIGTYQTKYVINAAGLYAEQIYSMLTKSEHTGRQLIPVKGEYYVLDRRKEPLVQRVLYPVPSERGKGVLVIPTIHGNVLIGPNAQGVEEKEDTTTSSEGLCSIKNQIGRILQEVPYQQVIRTFAGVRAQNEDRDFYIEELKDYPNFIHLSGIDSPGLSSAPAIAEYVVHELMGIDTIVPQKENYSKRRPFVDLKYKPLKEQQEYVTKDARFGHIVCRCEQVSEGEILDAIHRPLGATTVKGVKKRVRPGMGRCQGGFCEPHIIQILARERRCSPLEIRYDQEEATLMVEDRNKAGGAR